MGDQVSKRPTRKGVCALIEEVNGQEMLKIVHYMTEHFPYRLAGSPCEAAASRSVAERLKQLGLEVDWSSTL